MDSTARRLLVAVPTMLDPNFFRTVVFVIEHTPEGALGVVLNRPSEADLTDALPDWSDLVGEPAVAFVGGPVQPDAVIAVARVAAPIGNGGWQPLVGEVGTVDLGRSPADLGENVEVVRVFAGYAGWGPGQLEGELAQGGWYVVDAQPGDLLTPRPADLWRSVLRRQRGDLAVAANFPMDPGSN
jgi:putative transcriptional regulator